MSQQEVTGALSSGGRFRATSYMVEITNPTGEVAATFDLNDFNAIQRNGQVVTLKRKKGNDVTIETASLDDAGRLEAALRPTVAPIAAAPAKSGGGFGKFLKFGCLGSVGLIILIVIVAVATSGDGDDENVDVGSQPSATSTSSSSQEGSNDPTSPPAGQTQDRLNAGQSANIGDAEVTFVSARVATAEFIPPDDGNQYIATEFRVVNTGNDAYVLSSVLQFEMLDSESRKYDVTFYPDANGSLDGTIPAGGTLVGEVVFEVPVDTAPYVVRFQKSFFPDLAEWTVPQP